MKRILCLAMATLVLTSCPVAAQETDERDEALNTAGIFLGATTKFKSAVPDETSFTIAGEYEYRPPQWGDGWGIAGIIELIFAHELEGIIMPMLYYHLTEPWFLRTGAGLEIGREEEEASRKAHALFRFGVGYVIPVGSMLIVPSFDIDLVRTDLAIVFGAVIARDF